MRSPLNWYGGKSRMANKILEFIPEHKIYVEVFGGAAWLLFAKKPSPVEVYNDIDYNLVNFFRVLKDPEKFEKFYRKVALTPYSRAEHKYCADTYELVNDEIERAYRFFVAVRQGFSGHLGAGWSFNVTALSRGKAISVSRWLRTINELPAIASRLLNVQIECYDWRKILDIYDTEETFFYLDPPYIKSLRSKHRYKYELEDSDHIELVERLLNIKGMAILSGYDHPIYRPLEENGWVKKQYEVACHAVGRTRGTKLLGEGAVKKAGQTRIECLWICPKTIKKLNKQKLPLLHE